MKTIKYTLTALCLVLLSLTYGQTPVCTDFDSGSFDGWQNYNTISSITTPGPNGSNFLKLVDPQGPGGFTDAWGYNSTSYPYNWSDQYIGHCLCFDYNVLFDNHLVYTANVPLNIMIYDDTDPQSSTKRATFISNIITTDYEGWEHVCAPIELSDGVSLPSNADGYWTGVSPIDWNALLNHVGGIAFTTNISTLDVYSLYPIDLGVDNICIVDCNIDAPSDSAAYCCGGDNLVTNGNFEDLQNLGFTSSYGNTPLAPGNYTVGTSVTAQTYFNATVTDHSYCENPILYSSNENFMLVNGRTQQTANAVIWEQTISGLDTNSTYKFCANFKNMTQCTFDTLLRVNMRVVGIGASGFSPISTAALPCAWVNKEFDFTTGNATSYTLRIILNQKVNGDGNDLAIDDIAVTKLIDPELSITVQHQGNPQEIIASINTISSSASDDVLHGTDCEYYWFVAEVGSYSPVSLVPNTFAYGNGSGNTFGSAISVIPWNLTTNFDPDYIFAQNKLYIIGMYTPACGCYDEGFTFQLTLNNRTADDEVMTEELKQQIIDWILNGYSSNGVSLNSTQQLNDGSE